MRQPPAAVPAAMVSAQSTLIQVAIANWLSALSSMRRKLSQPGRSSRLPAEVAPTRARAMMPMVFWASFMPCESPIALAEKICALPKKPFRNRGLASFWTGPVRAPRKLTPAKIRPMIAKPSTKPSSGELNIGITTLGSRPLPCHQCSPPCHQMIEDQLSFEAASAAPQRPPTRACEELEGKPHHHVIRSQTMAPSSAQISTCGVTATTPASTRPEAMVLATAVPQSAPSRLVVAASRTAWPGLSTLVATTVAIELAVSWNPLMYSNIRATAITSRTRPRLTGYPRQSAQEFFRAMW